MDEPNESANLRPKKPVDPVSCGWTLLAKVDTRIDPEFPGGQYGVSISNSSGELGRVRYLLFDISQTEAEDSFGNTFYSEIDIVSASPSEPSVPAESGMEVFKKIDGQCRVLLDISETPDLADWGTNHVIPMALEWYPKIIAMLPGEGFKPNRTISIAFSENMQGVASTSRARIHCSARWMRQNLDGEALGAIFHELVHIAQQYGPGSSPVPGWLTEGIADYLRWFRFEPDSRGAEITSANIQTARYDAGYRPTANFLNWASELYARDLVPRLNASIRSGKYDAELWRTITGRSFDELGREWRSMLEKKLAEEGSSEKELSK
jgi:hypothetical protein